MKNYQELQMEIISLQSDIVTVSDGENGGDPEEGIWTPNY